MSRRGYRGLVMEGMMGPTKIRKRGCSSSSSSSSRIRNYRLNKRAILVGKSRAGLGIGLGGSRSSTPVPTWRTTPLSIRSAIESPRHSQSGKSTRPVSARRLAATLWEMNEVPSPKMSENNLELMKKHQKKNGSKMGSKKEKMQNPWGLHSGSGALPPHLSDPSHSPTVSEKMDRSGTGSCHRKTPSVSQRLRTVDQNVGVFDSISTAGFMEIETRSRPQSSSRSVSGGRNHLKDVSNALTTSKELLKIINRIWARADQPSSSMSLISALHSELERARLLVNQLIQENRSDTNDMNYLMKCFAEERALWKNKEQQAIESAIGSIANELEAERKLRRRFESMNKKLGKELAETKSSFIKAVEELENEKRSREITEQVCDELAKNIDEDRAEVEKFKRDSFKIQEEEEKGRETLGLAEKEKERSQMRLSDAKYQKHSTFSKLRRQLEVFLAAKRDKDEERTSYLSKSKIGGHQNEQEDDGEVEDGTESKEDSAESDLHSIELNTGINNKSQKWDSVSTVDRGSRKLSVNDKVKTRNSISELASWRGSSLQRSISDDVKWTMQGVGNVNYGDPLDMEDHRRSYNDEAQRYKSSKVRRDQMLLNSVLASPRDYHSPFKQRESSRPSRDAYSNNLEGSSLIQASSSKSRMSDVRGDNQSIRRSKW